MSGTVDDTRKLHAVIEFAHTLVAACLARQLEERSSRNVRDALHDVLIALAAAAAADVEMPLMLQLDDKRLYHDGVPLDGPSLQARSLLSCCKRRGIVALGLDTRLGQEELNRLFDLLLLPQHADAFDRCNRDATLAAFGVRNASVMLGTPGDPADRRSTVRRDDRALQHYQGLADALQNNHRLAHRDLELEIDATAAAIESTLLDFDEPSMLLSLAMKDDVDRFTVGHSVRVALLALQVARNADVPRDELVRIGTAALMHDIGKSKVPQEVLFKQGRLTNEEFLCMAEHPRLGAQILLEQHEHIDPSAVGAAYCHHMGPGGRGYPHPTMTVEPSSTSRLIRVCDVFEALTAVRPYKHALTPIEAYAVMFRNEGEFDAAWLRRFVRTLGLFPNGTRVRLDCGSQGIVIAQTEDIAGPVVRLVAGPDDAPLPAGHPERLRVGAPFEGREPRIAGVEIHQRHVFIPELDPADPENSAPTVHGACLGTPHVHP